MNIYNTDRFDRLPDAFLFDTDNTLYDYNPAHSFAYQAVRKKATEKLKISGAEFDEVLAKSKRQIKDRIPGTAASHSRLLYFQCFVENLGLGSQVLIALEFEQTYWRTFLSKAKLFDHVIEVLDDIRLLGIPMAIVTDLTAQIQFRKVIYFGLDHYFDYIVTSEEAGFDKPHEAAFNLAIEKMNPSGDDIWMIGDNPINDIEGAKKSLNATTLQKTHAGSELGDQYMKPDASFAKFSALRTLIKNLKEK